MKFTFVYPPNEPYSCCEGPAMELAGRDCLPVLSYPGSFASVYAECLRAEQPLVFWGGLTQLSWLFETAEMRALWRAAGKSVMTVTGKDLTLRQIGCAALGAKHVVAVGTGPLHAAFNTVSAHTVSRWDIFDYCHSYRYSDRVVMHHHGSELLDLNP